jgi:Arm DNA-binding domain
MLNDTEIRQAKSRARDYKLTDFDGLQLLVRASGSKLWRFAYRSGGKQKQLALGAYATPTSSAGRPLLHPRHLAYKTPRLVSDGARDLSARAENVQAGQSAAPRLRSRRIPETYRPWPCRYGG